MNLQVLVRNGSVFQIHPDQVRQWRNAGGSYLEELPGVYLHHICVYN